jgi:beta-glucosidase
MMTHRPALSDLTLHQKSSLGSGASFWRTKTAAGLPAAVLTDGPHGVRAQREAVDHLGVAPNAPATCFPPARSDGVYAPGFGVDGDAKG